MDPSIPASSEALADSPSALTELEAIYATAPIGLAVLDRELRFVRINERLAEMNGLPVGAHLGRSVREVVPDLSAQAEALLRRVVETGESVRDVALLGETPAQPGVTRTWIEQWSPVRDARGSVVGVSVVAEEVTRLRRAQTALRDSERRLFALIRNLPRSAVLVFGCEMRFRMAEGPALLAVGYRSEDFVGKTLLEAVGPVQADLYEADYRRALRGESFRHEQWWQGRWYVTHGIPLYGEDGTVDAVLALAHDSTDEKEAETALREADRRKDEFLAVLAHELRSPLSSLGNLLRVMERELLSSPAKRMLELGRRQFAQLSRLVDDLLDVSRISRGHIALRIERLAVQQVLDEVAGVLAERMRACEQRLVLEMPPEPVWVDADALRLAQILENLMSNASKYTDHGGQVTVVLRCTALEAVIEVRDTGVGIAADDLSKIFRLFARIERSPDRAEGGLGIGLALVRQLVELHGGRVGVHSDGPGTGATFTVTLPCSEGGGPR